MRNVVIPMEELMPLIQVQLQEGGHASLTVTGNSMYPMLRHRRDRVFLQPPDPVQKKGDLILYRRDSGGYVLHRVVRCKAPGTYICCGDNQWEPELVLQRQVLGKVYSFHRKDKTVKVTHRGYRFYVWLWVGVFPLRRSLLAVRRFLGKAYRKLRKTQNNGG